MLLGEERGNMFCGKRYYRLVQKLQNSSFLRRNDSFRANLMKNSAEKQKGCLPDNDGEFLEQFSDICLL